jgi:hypothetical protein
MPGELQNSKRTKHHTVDPWKGLVPSPRYSGERVRVRGSSIASIADGVYFLVFVFSVFFQVSIVFVSFHGH